MRCRIDCFLVLLASSSVFFFTGCSHPAQGERNPVAVHTMTLHPYEQGSVCNYSGHVEPSSVHTISFRVGGRIQKRLLTLGARVKKHQILFTIDPFLLDQQSSQANASYLAAQAQDQYAQRQQQRARYLLAQHFISPAGYENMVTQAQIAHQTAKATQAAWAIAQEKQRDSILRSPIDGIVTQVTADTGQVVASSQAVATIAATQNPEIEINVPEEHINLLPYATHLIIVLNTLPQHPWTGFIHQVARTADPLTGTYAVRVRCTHPDQHIQFGMTAHVQFSLPFVQEQKPLHTTIFAVPTTAVLRKDDAATVWLIRQEQAMSTRVNILGTTDTQYLITSPLLHTGDLIATSSAHLLRNDQHIHIIEETTQAIHMPVQPSS